MYLQDFVFPYATRLKWWVKGPQHHLLEGLQSISLRLSTEDAAWHQKKVARMKAWLLVKLLLLIPLSASAIAAVAGMIQRVVGDVAGADAALGLFTSLSTSFATIFAIAFLFASRVVSQLQADIIILLAKSSHQPIS